MNKKKIGNFLDSMDSFLYALFGGLIGGIATFYYFSGNQKYVGWALVSAIIVWAIMWLIRNFYVNKK
ncbi:MAG: hypothetical protein KKH88_01605 [Nanoarchaeota archaeon]|nr:hypothetical protein [Nanoarchaeota archaeon]